MAFKLRTKKKTSSKKSVKKIKRKTTRSTKPSTTSMSLGDPQSPTYNKNCLTCSRFGTCKDIKKNYAYLCSNWKGLDEMDQLLEGLSEAADLESDAEKVSREETPESRSQELDLEKMIEDVIKSGVNIPPDVRIDDRDIPQAKNFVEWSMGSKFSGADFVPYARQFEIVLKYLAEYCPLCSDMEYWNGNVKVDDGIEGIRERVVLLENNVCPKCKTNKTDLVYQHGLYDPLELVAVLGQRSGKTASLIMLESYNLHKWLKLPSPPKVLGLMPNQLLTATYSAVTFAQAKENIWDPLYIALTDSPWFREYNSLLSGYQEDLGEEIYTVKDTFARYRHRNLFLYPSGPNAKTMRGRTRLSGAIDELGWFGESNTGKVKMDGAEIHGAMQRSMLTVKSAYRNLIEKGTYGIPKPLFSCISSPSSVRDMVMTLYKRSQDSLGGDLIGFHAPTWEINPTIKKERDLAQEFKDDFVKAERDYGANPPLSSDAWINNTDLLEGLFQGGTNSLDIRQKNTKTRAGQNVTSGKVRVRSRALKGHVMCIDAGYTNNSFAVAIGHLDDRERVIVDGVGELIPSKEFPIFFPSVTKNVLRKAGVEHGVQLLGSDRWQNISTMQTLEEEGIQSTERRLKYGDFEEARQAIYDGKIILPRLEMSIDEIESIDDYRTDFKGKPVSHLLYQFLTVRDYEGASVEKGEGCTDDIFRCVIMLHTLLKDEEVREFLDFEENTRVIGALGSVAGLSQGGPSKPASTGNTGGMALGSSGGNAFGKSGSKGGGVGSMGGKN